MKQSSSPLSDAYEVIGHNNSSPFLFSCEHASNFFPADIPVSSEDQAFKHTHWAWDIGVAELLRQLVDHFCSQAIFSRFSRLIIDPNRDIRRSSLIPETIEGHALSFNQNLSTDAIQDRLHRFYHPYHEAFSRMVKERCQNEAPFILISFHSFTPIWNSHLRTMDIGVLYEDYEDIAIQLKEAFERESFFVALNEPYSGRNGLMYSVHQQGTRYNIPHLELEISQFLLSSPERVAYMAKKIATALESFAEEYFPTKEDS